MVTGTVTIEGGGPVEGAIVIWGGFNGGEWIAFTDRAGRYETPDPSKWAGEAEVYHPEYGHYSDRVISTRSMVVAPARVDIEIPAVETIAGRVVDAVGEPVAGARISVAGWPMAISDEVGGFFVQADLATVVTAVHGDSVARVEIDSREVELRLAPGRWIRGRVIDGGSGSALPFASVTVWESRWFIYGRDAFADAKGRYEVGPLPAGHYGVVADSTTDGWRHDRKEADLISARQVSLEHRLERVRSISGRVVDHSGEPLAGTSVVILEKDDPLVLGTGLMPAGSVVITGCDGGFEYPLDEYLDTFRVGAIKKDFAPALTAWLESDPHNGGIELTMPTGIEVHGRVVGPGDIPLDGVEIAVISDTRSSAGVPPGMYFSEMIPVTWFYTTSADGTFRFPLIEGDWNLAFGKKGYVATAVPKYRVEAGAESLAISLERSLMVRGRVQTSDGLPVEDAEVMIGGTAFSPEFDITGPEGHFELEVATAGLHVVRAYESGTGRTVAAPAEAPGPAIVLEFPTTYSVSGRVLDSATGDPIPEARIHAELVGQTTENDSYDSTSFSGDFTLEGLAAGRHLLHVTAEGYLPRTADEVATGPGAPREAITVSLDRGLLLAGTVVDAGGEALEGVGLVFEGSVGGEETTVRGATDSLGVFDLHGIPTGEGELFARAEGFTASRLTIDVQSDVHDLLFELERGAELSGRVVDQNGDPLEYSWVKAESANDPSRTQRTDAGKDGTFSFTGLAPGTWSISAQAHGYKKAIVESIDPQRRDPVTLVMEEWPTGTIVGRVDGQIENSRIRVAAWSKGDNQGGAGQADVETDGSYRIDDAPTGLVEVTASEWSFSNQRSRSKSAEVPVGGEVKVDFDLDDGSVLSGRVTRHGEPVPGVMLNVMGGSNESSATTDADGSYRCRVPDGSYELTVYTMERQRREFEIVIQGATTFDIELGGGGLIGRVFDRATGKPISGVEVEVEHISPNGQGLGSSDLKTDSTGIFRFADLPAGPQMVRVAHPDYAQHRRNLELSVGSVAEIEVGLEKAEGIKVLLVDARSGTSLSGTVVARDLNNRVVFDGSPRRDGTGVRLPLPPGAYKVSASATNFATHTEVVTAPSDEVVIGLHPGGTLIVRSEGTYKRLAKLIMPSGEEYIRCWCNRIAEIELDESITGIENIAAGSYDLTVRELDGSTTAYPVVVIEGQTTEVLIQ